MITVVLPGRDVFLLPPLLPSTQVYPGLMVTAGLIHYVLNMLHVTVHIRDVCVFLAPVFSGFTAISTFLLTRELWNQGAGLLAACFIAIVPGYISRSVAGSFDNEGIAIFALQFTYYLWVRMTGELLLRALVFAGLKSGCRLSCFLFHLVQTVGSSREKLERKNRASLGFCRQTFVFRGLHLSWQKQFLDL